jgi:hypothetical protein
VAGTVLGTPAEDGGGVVSAPVFQAGTGAHLGVYLLNAATGAVVGFVRTNTPLFGQAVFAGNELVVAAGGHFGVQGFAVPTVGPPVTKVSPSLIGRGVATTVTLTGSGVATTVTLTGSGFSGTPAVHVSGGSPIDVLSVTVTSPTTMAARLYAGTKVALGSYNITVIEPGPTSDSCTGCLSVGTPPPPPAPTSISPASYAPGATGVAATVDGSGFASGAVVNSSAGIRIFDVTSTSASQLAVRVSVAGTVSPGTYNIYVKNPDGYSGVCKDCLTVAAGAPSPTGT